MTKINITPFFTLNWKWPLNFYVKKLSLKPKLRIFIYRGGKKVEGMLMESRGNGKVNGRKVEGMWRESGGSVEGMWSENGGKEVDSLKIEAKIRTKIYK